MTALVDIPNPSRDLPSLIERAATMLSGAKTAAEVLEAREAAGLAYDVAKRAARMKSAKAAHDDLVAAAHRAQADALEIEAAAKRRLADEYDAAQARGEVARLGTNQSDLGVSVENTRPATSADLGLSRKDIHEARQLRDAETNDPGIVRRTLDERLERGEEPTRSALRRAAEARLERSIDRLKRTQDSVRRLGETKRPPPTPEERARQAAVFGTPEDRAIHERLVEIVERIGEQPAPAEAVRRIPPASRHSVDTAPMRRAAAWLTEFSTLFEQEVQHGTDASE